MFVLITLKAHEEVGEFFSFYLVGRYYGIKAFEAILQGSASHADSLTFNFGYVCVIAEFNYFSDF